MILPCHEERLRHGRAKITCSWEEVNISLFLALETYFKHGNRATQRAADMSSYFSSFPLLGKFGITRVLSGLSRKKIGMSFYDIPIEVVFTNSMTVHTRGIRPQG